MKIFFISQLIWFSNVSMSDSDFRSAKAAIEIVEKNKISKDNFLDFCYTKMLVAAYENDAKLANKYADEIENHFGEVPRRMKTMAYIVKEDSKHWKKDDMPDIVRNMKNVSMDLKSGNADQIVLNKQKHIVNQLDKLIKEQEDEQKKQQQASSSESQPQPQSHAQETIIMGGNSGAGKVDEKQLKKYAEVWGTLPPKEREKVMTEITRDYPVKYKELIESYNKSLSRSSNNQ